MVELVYTRDLKFRGASHAGSIPAPGTANEAQRNAMCTVSSVPAHTASGIETRSHVPQEQASVDEAHLADDELARKPLSDASSIPAPGTSEAQ